MERTEILKILRAFGIKDYSEKKEIDTSRGDDKRINIILDKKYVLRINGPAMTEERLGSIDRLAERYQSIGILAPRLYKTAAGTYTFPYGPFICYLSKYLDLSSLEDMGKDVDTLIEKEVFRSIGVFSARYKDVDLSDVTSMWSVIDLAPLDTDVDEKQENLDLLVDTLREAGESDIADEIVLFNGKARERLKKIYKDLPRCVIQGDLNPTNILIKDGHFAGLIDFNMAGTEVNVNHFCCETNDEITEAEFAEKSADRICADWFNRQQEGLNVILSEYALNELEKEALVDYRRICRISMYPNVMSFIEFLKRDKEKTLNILRNIMK